ncbi:DUF721 domain-containing protein [Methylobacterium isbiliense]|jgi:hypothetical protein|uniref:DUF721 domain-containing protein n=1 Tax=Methylobacterium isbiliense TaxID=315478 RepID=A0ABQ4S6Y2_9HYPH|nr:DciA family protein [Methylobacterium isbiliense]MDN3623145.1 DciA family protein [Methylobacterium isbiliense]GJD98215.1 hypothetical protein GMJLKIPL_0122 [Methylobacterium isbiliense]
MARPKPLSELIERSLGPVFAAQGFASTDILASWPEIVGERLARVCRPEKFEWPRRRKAAGDARSDPGTLVVRVDGAFALELQHLAPVVIERINAHYGWACVGRISLRQDRLARAVPRARPARTLDPLQRGTIAKAVSGIAEDGLRDALDRLGVAVLTNRNPG